MKRAAAFLVLAVTATGCLWSSLEYSDGPGGGRGGGRGGGNGGFAGNGGNIGCPGGMVQACILGANATTALATNVDATVTIAEKGIVPRGKCAEFNRCFTSNVNDPVQLKLDGPGGPWFAVLGIPGLGAEAFDAGQILELRVEADNVGGRTTQAFSLRRRDAGFVAFGLRKARGPLAYADIAGTGVGISDHSVLSETNDGGVCSDQIHSVSFTTGGSVSSVPPGTSTPAGAWYVAVELATTHGSDAGTCSAEPELYVGGSQQN